MLAVVRTPVHRTRLGVRAQDTTRALHNRNVSSSALLAVVRTPVHRTRLGVCAQDTTRALHNRNVSSSALLAVVRTPVHLTKLGACAQDTTRALYNRNVSSSTLLADATPEALPDPVRLDGDVISFRRWGSCALTPPARPMSPLRRRLGPCLHARNRLVRCP
jgi:hypothetical protein